MQIALTKKLADAMKLKPPAIHGADNPLFSWTANWTKVWNNRRADDMLVLVNNATRFAVAIYQFRRKDLKNVAEIMRTAISNTLLAMHLNPEMVSEYMRLAGEVQFVKNSSRQAAAWVTKAGNESAFHVGREYNGIEKMFNDTIGAFANYYPVNYSANWDDAFEPAEKMIEALATLTGKQPFKYRAFELLVTLDLNVYKAVRRIIVAADLEFAKLHKVLQAVFGWQSYHLYDFTIKSGKKGKRVARLVPYEEDLECDEEAILMENHRLSEYMPEHKHIIYTYDYGDNWEHDVKLIRVLEDYDRQSPYLLEAKGQAPPEDVGGVGGFIEFHEIMMDPDHPEYEDMEIWAGYWAPALSEWESRPKVIHV